MSAIATRRILSDYQDLIKNTKLLNDNGIHFYLDEENVFHMRAMIIGPEDTPYEKGFYLFDIIFPKQYPNLPPTFTYMTNHRNIRFNPNLYTSGKVCLSLLNTWSGSQTGEGWTAANTITSVFMSIQGMVLNENPLINEPGHETINDSHKQYNRMLQHENFYTAVLRMIKSTPNGFQPFQEVMKRFFLKHLDWYLDKTLEYLDKYYKIIEFKCSYQNLSVHQQYHDIFISLDKMAQEVGKELDIPVEEIIAERRVKLTAMVGEKNTTKKTDKTASSSLLSSSSASASTSSTSSSSLSSSSPSTNYKCCGTTTVGKPCGRFGNNDIYFSVDSKKFYFCGYHKKQMDGFQASLLDKKNKGVKPKELEKASS